MMDLNRDACYRALETRDVRFDGRFYTCVVTTGIYCRPICPARTPKPEHCLFVPSAAAAQAAGFRPCLRCRPEVAPGVAGWRGTGSTVSRALSLIAEGGLDEGADVEALAERVGVGARHLRRLFDRHVGASPVAVAQAHRLLFPKKLIHETALPMTEVALAAGFGSVRRFNDVVRRTFGRAPSELRRAERRETPLAGGVTLDLPFTPPYDWEAMVGFLAGRAIPGVEEVVGGGYRRTVAVAGARGVVEVAPVPGADRLRATIRLSRVSALAAVVTRLRRLFDLDADAASIARHLGADPRLAAAVAARPGLRVPGAWDGFELAVRAILGQQVSVAGATTLAGRIAAAYGEGVGDDPLFRQPAGSGLNRLFPRPEVLAAADLRGLGLPGARARAISALAAAWVADPNLLEPRDSLDTTVEKLVGLPGIGPWTAQYIAMRALREPDAFPASDLGLLRALEGPEGRPTPRELTRIAEAWRPWRAYAALHLWMKDSPAKTEGATP